jgi:hypothetical protein
MAIDERLKDLRGTGRRDFLRWATAVAAVLGLERSRLLNVINDTGGTALADTIGQRKRLLSVHMVAGNGGLANFQLIWPWPEVAKSTNGNYAFHALGKAVKATQTDTEFYYAPETPFQKLGKSKQVTLILGGTNQTHTQAVALDASAGTSMLASVAALQQVEATLLPVIAVNPITFGNAPGAPAVASVANAAGLVDLFNSAASRTLLQKPEASSLHEAYYKAFLGLNAAAGRSSLIKSYGTGKVAVNLLAQNLAAQLKPTTTDLTNFGITAGTATNLTEMANTLIIANRAFKLGLCSSVILPAFRDDPHGLFAGGDGAATTKAQTLGRILDAWMADAMATPSPVGNKSLGDELCLTVHGDTPKQPMNRSGWPDGTPGGSNWIYVMSNGFLKTGTLGTLNANNTVSGWDEDTGKVDATKTAANMTQAAVAAVLFSVAKGDARAAQDFSRVTLGDGVVNKNIL